MQVINRQLRDALHPASLIFIEEVNKNSPKALESDEIKAIDFLVSSLIGNGLWEKFRAIYPFIGRYASACSYNLKNPFRHKIVWYGNLLFDKNGVTNYSKSGYGNTFVAPSWFSDNNIHISVYNTTNWISTNEESILIGTRPKTTGAWMHSISLRRRPQQFVNNDPSRGISVPPIFTYSCGPYPNRSAGFDAGDFLNAQAFGLIVGVNGLYCYTGGERLGATSVLADPISSPINPSQTGSNGVTVTTYSQFPFLLFTHGPFGSVLSNDVPETANANIRFASIGNALSDEDNKIFYKIVEEFQFILKRNVGVYRAGENDMFVDDTNPRAACEIAIDKISIRKSKHQYLLIDEFEDGFKKEKERISPDLKINSIKVFGPRRLYLSDSTSASVSILSMSEI